MKVVTSIEDMHDGLAYWDYEKIKFKDAVEELFPFKHLLPVHQVRVLNFNTKYNKIQLQTVIYYIGAGCGEDSIRCDCWPW